jgi:hypothetical protein
LTADRTLRHRLTQRFFVRWHMSLILAGVVLAGVGASRVLLALGVRSPPLRWLLVLVLAYLVFFVLVRLWMAYIASTWPSSVDTEPEPAPKRRSDRPGSWLDWFDIGLGGGESLGEGVFLFLMSVVLTLLLALAFLTVVYAPVLLAEAAVQALLASGLLPAARRLEARGWTGSLFRATVVPLGVVAVVTVGTGWLIQWWCPEAVRLADVFTRCRS